jgi:hypothetical protein
VEGGMLWRADMMERACAVARKEDISRCVVCLYYIYIFFNSESGPWGFAGAKMGPPLPHHKWDCDHFKLNRLFTEYYLSFF